MKISGYLTFTGALIASTSGMFPADLETILGKYGDIKPADVYPADIHMTLDAATKAQYDLYWLAYTLILSIYRTRGLSAPRYLITVYDGDNSKVGLVHTLEDSVNIQSVLENLSKFRFKEPVKVVDRESYDPGWSKDAKLGTSILVFGPEVNPLFDGVTAVILPDARDLKNESQYTELVGKGGFNAVANPTAKSIFKCFFAPSLCPSLESQLPGFKLADSPPPPPSDPYGRKKREMNPAPVKQTKESMKKFRLPTLAELLESRQGCPMDVVFVLDRQTASYLAIHAFVTEIFNELRTQRVNNIKIALLQTDSSLGSPQVLHRFRSSSTQESFWHWAISLNKFLGEESEEKLFDEEISGDVGDFEALNKMIVLVTAPEGDLKVSVIPYFKDIVDLPDIRRGSKFFRVENPSPKLVVDNLKGYCLK